MAKKYSKNAKGGASGGNQPGRQPFRVLPQAAKMKAAPALNKGGPPPVQQALQLARQIANALRNPPQQSGQPRPGAPKGGAQKVRPGAAAPRVVPTTQPAGVPTPAVMKTFATKAAEYKPKIVPNTRVIQALNDVGVTEFWENKGVIDTNFHPVSAAVRGLITVRAFERAAKVGVMTFCSLWGGPRDLSLVQLLNTGVVDPRTMLLHRPIITSHDITRNVNITPEQQVHNLANLPVGVGYFMVDVYHVTYVLNGTVVSTAFNLQFVRALLRPGERLWWIGRKFLDAMGTSFGEAAWYRKGEEVIFRPDKASEPYAPHSACDWLWESDGCKQDGEAIAWTTVRTIGDFHLVEFIKLAAPDAQTFTPTVGKRIVIPSYTNPVPTVPSWIDELISPETRLSWVMKLPESKFFPLREKLAGMVMSPSAVVNIPLRLLNKLVLLRGMKVVDQYLVRQLQAEVVKFVESDVDMKMVMDYFPTLISTDYVSSVVVHVLRMDMTMRLETAKSYAALQPDLAKLNDQFRGLILPEEALIGSTVWSPLRYWIPYQVFSTWMDVTGQFPANHWLRRVAVVVLAPLVEEKAKHESIWWAWLFPVYEFFWKQLFVFPAGVSFSKEAVLGSLFAMAMHYVANALPYKWAVALHGTWNLLITILVTQIEARGALTLPIGLKMLKQRYVNIIRCVKKHWNCGGLFRKLVEKLQNVRLFMRFKIAMFLQKVITMLQKVQTYVAMVGAVGHTPFWVGAICFLLWLLAVIFADAQPAAQPPMQPVYSPYAQYSLAYLQFKRLPELPPVSRDNVLEKLQEKDIVQVRVDMTVDTSQKKKCDRLRVKNTLCVEPETKTQYSYFPIQYGVPGFFPARTNYNLWTVVDCRLLLAAPSTLELIGPVWDYVRKQMSIFCGNIWYDEIHDSMELASQWLDHIDDARKKKRALAALDWKYEHYSIHSWQQLAEFNQVNIMVKCDELLVKMTEVGPNLWRPSPKPRCIANVDPKVGAIVGPIVYEAQVRLKKLWWLWTPPSCPWITVTYGGGMNDLDLSIWFHAVQFEKDRKHLIVSGDDSLLVFYDDLYGWMSIEGDFTSFDQSQEAPILEIEHIFLRYLGVPRVTVEQLEWLSTAKYVGYTRESAGKIEIGREARAMRDTGKSDTSLGNSIVTGMFNVALLAFGIRIWVEDTQLPTLDAERFAKYNCATFNHWLPTLHGRKNGWIPICEESWNSLMEHIKMNWGLEVKIKINRDFTQSTFLKGMWYRVTWDSADRYLTRLAHFWGPLPSRVLKVGKCFNDPRRLYAVKDLRVACLAHLRNVAKGFESFLPVPLLLAFVNNFKDCTFERLESGEYRLVGRIDAGAFSPEWFRGNRTEIVQKRLIEIPYTDHRIIASGMASYARLHPEAYFAVGLRYNADPDVFRDFERRFPRPEDIPVFFNHPLLENLAVVDYS